MSKLTKIIDETVHQELFSQQIINQSTTISNLVREYRKANESSKKVEEKLCNFVNNEFYLYTADKNKSLTHQCLHDGRYRKIDPIEILTESLEHYIDSNEMTQHEIHHLIHYSIARFSDYEPINDAQNKLVLYSSKTMGTLGGVVAGTYATIVTTGIAAVVSAFPLGFIVGIPLALVGICALPVATLYGYGKGAAFAREHNNKRMRQKSLPALQGKVPHTQAYRNEDAFDSAREHLRLIQARGRKIRNDESVIGILTNWKNSSNN